MRSLFVAVFFIGCVSLTFAQQPTPTLAPNPACAGNAVYCRGWVSNTPSPAQGVAVIGFHNGYLYGYTPVNGGQLCPGAPSNSPTSISQTLCFYASSTLAPETWVYQGNYAPPYSSAVDPGYVFEILFGTGGCSGYKYIYTSTHSILRATSSSSDWTFHDVAVPNSGLGFTGLPNIPGPNPVPVPSPTPFFSTASRAGSFAIGTDSSGNTRLFFGNYPSNNTTYTSTTCAQNSNNCPHAYVWHSDSCGTTWATPYGIAEPAHHCQEVHALNVDPTNLSNLYVMVDGENADGNYCGLWQSTDGGNTFTELDSRNIGINFVLPPVTNGVFAEPDWTDQQGDTGGPLFTWNKGIPSNFQIIPWPSAESAWTGRGYGINLTSEQNIFLETVDNHTGFWYFAPPFYNSPVILEDATNASPQISSLLSPTIEATDPSKHTVYVYNSNIWFVKPRFVARLSGFVDSTGGLHWSYLDAGMHAHNMWWNSSSSYGDADATASAGGGPAAVPGSDLAAFGDPSGNGQHWTYLDSSSHVRNVWWSSGTYGNADVTMATGAPAAASGSSLAGYTDSYGAQHWVYLDSNNDVHDASWTNGTYADTNLTVFMGSSPAVSGSDLAGFYSGGKHWSYLDSNQHVHNMWQTTSTVYGDADVTGITGASPAVYGSNIAAFADSSGGQHWTYFDSNYHVWNLWWSGGYYGAADVTATTGAPVALQGSELTGFGDASGVQHWVYLDSNLHLHDLSWSAGTYGNTDLTVVASVLPAVAGSGLAAFADHAGVLHWSFIDSNNHVHDLSRSGSTYTDRDLTALMGSPLAH
jgi:hypothetical protein